MAAPSFEDYFNIGKAEAVSRRPELTFNEGDLSEFFVAAAAAMADNLTGYVANRVRATFVDGASGDDLTILADDRYNIQRSAAQFATGVVAFTRTNGNGAPAGTLPAGFVVATQKDAQGTEQQYILLTPLSFGLTELGPKNVNVIATVSGKAGNVDPAKVVRTISTPFDSTFTVTNNAKLVGGDIEEADEDLRERVRGFPNTLRRGTIAALEFGALLVPSVKRASVVETSGIANLYVSDANGGSSPTMVFDVAAEIENWRAAGVVVNVSGGALFSLTGINISLTTRAGTDSQAIAENIKSAIVARIAKLKIGEACSQDLIKQAAMNVDPDNILAVLVNSPVGTVVPAANQLIRTTTADITVA